MRIGDGVALGQLVRDARERAGLSQTALAARANVQRPWLSRLEAGKGNPTFDVLTRPLDAVGLIVDVHPPASARIVQRGDTHRHLFIHVHSNGGLEREPSRTRELPGYEGRLNILCKPQCCRFSHRDTIVRARGAAVAANSVDQSVSDFHTNADGATWATYDFGTANKVFLSGYSIRQRTGSSGNNLRNWVIWGSNDASNWQSLHTGSTSAGQAVWHDHSLTTPDTFGYRYLRLQMSGPSSTGGGFLAYSEIEFYGSILLSLQAPLITTASMVSGSPQITVAPTWGALPTSYAIFRNGSEVGTVSASGATPVVWSDSSEPAGVVYYTAKSVNVTATSLASAAAYPQVSSMPSPVISHAGNVTIGSKIYFIGGYTGSASNALRSYDMATGTWATLANVPQVLWATFATAHADGSKITVAGGYNGTSTGIGNALVYTVATNTWQTYAGAGTTVFNSNSGARVGDDLYLFGGYENSVGDFVQSYKFNLNTRTWTRLADLPGGWQMRWSVADGAGGIYVGGGITSGANLSTVYRYDVAANTFTAKANQPFAGRGSSAVLLANGSLRSWGERTTHSPQSATESTFTILATTLGRYSAHSQQACSCRPLGFTTVAST